jgi:hypothetical protein
MKNVLRLLNTHPLNLMSLRQRAVPRTGPGRPEGTNNEEDASDMSLYVFFFISMPLSIKLMLPFKKRAFNLKLARFV